MTELNSVSSPIAESPTIRNGTDSAVLESFMTTSNSDRQSRHSHPPANVTRSPNRVSLSEGRAPSSNAVERIDSRDRSGIQLYLNEIGKFPLLTREEEVELAEKIKAGDRKARERMISSNLRLVVKIAYDYRDYGLPVMDLISEGNIGLIKAVERFDPEKGGKLSTYASWWIKQSIKGALANQSKTIRLPVHLVDRISQIRKISRHLAEELGREPTNEELGDILEISASKVAHLKTVSARPASLNAPLGDDYQGGELGDVVGDENAHSPFERLNQKSMQGDLSELIERLEERESQIIKLRFGIERDSALTLEEVGHIFGITRERVRQLQNMALLKMRRIMFSNERQLSRAEVEEANRERERRQVFQEFYQESNLARAPVR